MTNTNSYPQLQRDDIVAMCKKWAKNVRNDGLDLLTTDYEAAISLTDNLAYPLDMQEWIKPDTEPELYAIVDLAGKVDSTHDDRPAWEDLLQRIDALE